MSMITPHKLVKLMKLANSLLDTAIPPAPDMQVIPANQHLLVCSHFYSPALSLPANVHFLSRKI